MKIKKGVIPVAGLGTRFLPFSKSVPKEMIPLVDIPVIQLIVEEFVASGIEEIVLVTSKNKTALEDHFDTYFELEERLRADKKTQQLRAIQHLPRLAKFVFVRQFEALGNGHALLQAESIIGDEPFAFAYGDDVIHAKVPAIKQMMEVFQKYNGSVIGCMEVNDEDTEKYGIVKPKPLSPKVNRVLDIVEKPGPKAAPSRLASTGRYIFTPSIFKELKRIKPGKGGEIWLVDAVKLLLKREKVFSRTFDGVYFDCGNKLEFLKASIDYGLRHPETAEGLREYLKNLSL